jgi:hypothetical protein
MFRGMFAPILRSNLNVYTALVRRTNVLLTGDMVEMELELSPFYSNTLANIHHF